jgi:hypothetical protein
MLWYAHTSLWTLCTYQRPETCIWHAGQPENLLAVLRSISTEATTRVNLEGSLASGQTSSTVFVYSHAIVVGELLLFYTDAAGTLVLEAHSGQLSLREPSQPRETRLSPTSS